MYDLSETSYLYGEKCICRSRLEMLNLSGNHLSSVVNLASSLPVLIALNIGE